MSNVRDAGDPWLDAVIAVGGLYNDLRPDWAALSLDERLAVVRGLVWGVTHFHQAADRRAAAVEASARLLDVVVAIDAGA